MPRWNSCNILQKAPDANRLWQFEAKGNFKLNRELRSASDVPMPPKLVAKSWDSFWKPKLNVAWLPPENVFLRVIELPKSTFDETVSMVELQLEKLSPLPVAQIVWTLHILPQATGELQTVIVVVAARSAVEAFLGELENKKFLADRLEVPMLDQLEAVVGAEDSAWIYPAANGNPHAALVAWWHGGVLRSVSIVLLSPEGDRAANLKGQLEHLIWAGELEGWLTSKPQWHLVADGVSASEWEALLKQALDVPVKVLPPLSAGDLAVRTARRATQSPNTNPAAVLLPAEFSTRYREQFHDRLWLHGLYAAGIAYVVFCVIYFCGMQYSGYQNDKMQQQVAALADTYTNAMQIQAKYAILQGRNNLKFAALDCWKQVAYNLPDGITLDRFGFGDGQMLTLAGTTTSDQLQALDKFQSSLQDAKGDDGKPMFHQGDPLSYNMYQNNNQNNIRWNFSLQLVNGGKAE